MNRNMAIRRLWWKELRQLVPLIGLLMLVGLVLILFSLLLDRPTEQRQFMLVVLLGMPSLFAAGAGALLVGQEKEVRSIDWLRSLPVPSVDVVRTKLLAALLALAAVWSVSFGLALVARVLESTLDFNWVTWIWPLYSLYLLLVGFATAWQLRSSLVSLLLVVPLAGLPLILASLHEAFVMNTNRDPAPWLVAAYIALVAGGVLVWGWRAALAYMSPERSSVAPFKRLVAASPVAVAVAPRSSPAPALLWQFYAQNRGLLLGLTLVILVSLFPLASLYASTTRPLRPNFELVGFLTGVAIFLSLSWLGLLVFQTDAIQRRSQFLADRGVSPRLTWLTRQGLPWLLMVVAATFALFIGRNFWGNVGGQVQVVVIAMAIAIFGASQWLGQALRSMILGAIIAPLVSLMFVGYLTHAVWSLVAPPWIIALTLVIPLIATFGATAAWMDGRTGWRFWTWHGSLLAVAALLPSLNYLYLTATYPRMSAASRTELTRIAEYPHQGTANVSYFGLQSGLRRESNVGLQGGLDGNTLDPSEASSPPEADLTLAEARTRAIADLRRQMDLNPTGMVSWGFIQRFAADAIIDRIGDPDANDQERVQRYRESLELIAELTKRQRRALHLLDQDLADDYEMLLLEEMQAPLAQQRMGDELHASIVAQLGDTAGRDSARRIALAVSWQQAQSSKVEKGGGQSSSLGGYDLLLLDLQQRVTSRDVWQTTRKVGLVSEYLLQLLDATSDAQREAARGEIQKLLGFSEPPNISSGAYQQSADGPKLLYGELGGRPIPGRAWHGDWERRAASLRTTSESEAEASEGDAEASGSEAEASDVSE